MRYVLALIILFSFSVSFGATITLQGQFENHPGTLTITDNTTQVTAQFLSSSGNKDILGNCQSNIGAAQKVKRDSQGRLSKVILDFDAGNCISVEGKTLNLSWKYSGSTQTVKAEILSHYEVSQPFCPIDPNGIEHCPPKEYNAIWLSGRFSN